MSHPTAQRSRRVTDKHNDNDGDNNNDDDDNDNDNDDGAAVGKTSAKHKDLSKRLPRYTHFAPMTDAERQDYMFVLLLRIAEHKERCEAETLDDDPGSFLDTARGRSGVPPPAAPLLAQDTARIQRSSKKRVRWVDGDVT